MQIGDSIKTLRKEKGLSQIEFAKQMDTTQQRISEWECNKVEPSLYNIIKILKVLDISFEELIDDVQFK